VTRILTALKLACLEIVRNRTAVLLILILPGLFETLIYITTPTRVVSFDLPSLGPDASIDVPASAEAFIFMGVIAVAFIAGFVGLTLMQRSFHAQRRLVLSGFPIYQLFLSRLLTLLLLIVLVSIYTGCIVEAITHSSRFVGIVIGLALTGAVYGAYGLLIGALWKHSLESVLSIVLLTNIDVAWLQNPIFYTEATNRALIHYLPGYFPSQVAMVAAFTDGSVANAALGAGLYFLGLLLTAGLLAYRKLRVLA
jgi:hypothetical protein